MQATQTKDETLPTGDNALYQAPAAKELDRVSDVNDDAVFCCVTSAITVAKNYQVKSAASLRTMLLERGFDDELITKAFGVIGQSLRGRYSSLAETSSAFNQ